MPKYCTRYRCGRILPEDFSGDTCPYCATKEYDWEIGKVLKELPSEAHEVEKKCKTCGSEKELSYSEKRDYGSFSMGNDYECKTCRDAWYAEVARQEAMNYLLINHSDDETEFYRTKEDVEKFFEDIVRNWEYEYLEKINEDFVILKIELIDGLPHKKHFERNNVIQYADEWYHVEEVIIPEYSCGCDSASIDW